MSSLLIVNENVNEITEWYHLFMGLVVSRSETAALICELNYNKCRSNFPQQATRTKPGTQKYHHCIGCKEGILSGVKIHWLLG